MSGKQVKKYKRIVKRTMNREQNKIVTQFLDIALDWPFIDRVKFAWSVVRGRIRCK